MKKITINTNTFYENYNELKKEWEKAANAFISINESSAEKINDLCIFLLNKTDDDFALDVLSELSESENINIEICKEIFRKGDVSCKVAVCLRNDLDDELKSICLDSDIMEVREHYRLKNT